MSLQMKGFEQLREKLKEFPTKQATPAMRRAVRAGTTVLRAAVKKATPVDEGILRKAQDLKVVVKGYGGFGVVGADVAKLQAAHAENPDRPVNIDWLVENGHHAPNGTFVAPSGYMRRAAREAMPQAEARATAVLAEAIATLEGK